MKVTTIIATKGGIGKTTTGANLGAISADAGLRTLLIDADPQPSVSSFFQLEYEAPCGFYELIAQNETNPERIISRTVIPNLSVITNNDPHSQLVNMMLQAPDGRIRLKNLISSFSDFDLVIIDTQGTRTVIQEMAVLASELAISPIQPHMLAAREFHRGTGQLFSDLEGFKALGLTIPPCKIVINMLDQTADARMIADLIRTNFNQGLFEVVETAIPQAVSFRGAATQGIPTHRLEYRAPTDRKAPAALDILRSLAIELFPEWRERYEALTADVVEEIVKGANS